MRIPLEITECLTFEFSYPFIKIAPWNEEIKTNIYQLCSILAEYSAPQWFAENTTRFEYHLDSEKTPYKDISLTKNEMEKLMTILDGIASSRFSPSGELHYQNNLYGRSHFDSAQRSLEAFVANINNAELKNSSSTRCTLI